jgi:hypothetical protein
MTSTNEYSAVPALAKRALVCAAEEAYDRISRSAGVADQMNASHLLEVIEKLESLNLSQAYILARKIDEVETYDPAADKWGFGPRKVNPMDFVGYSIH